MGARLGVPVLTRDYLYAEKLLANADRWADKAVLRLRDRSWLRKCMSDMAMDPALEGEILTQLGGPLEVEG